MFSSSEKRAHRFELRFSADERGRLSREIRHAALDRPWGREIDRESLDAKLVQALRPGEVLQPVVAEVAEGEAVEVLGEEVAGGL